MKTALNREPVSVLHPTTEQFVVVSRGDEFPDDHPFATLKQHQWLFEETPDPVDVRSVPIEQATRRPGEVRTGKLRGNR
jgi:hypothetical protein